MRKAPKVKAFDFEEGEGDTFGLEHVTFREVQEEMEKKFVAKCRRGTV